MRQLTFLLFCLSFTINAFAGLPEKFLERYTNAKECYIRGLSQEGNDAITSLQLANKKFEECLTACEIAGSVLWDKEDLKSRISKCENAICLKRQEQEAKQRAEQAHLEAVKKAEKERLVKEEEGKRQKQAEELEAKRQKRIEDKLVFVSSDAFIFDRKYDLHSSVERALSDDGFKLTDDPEKARWSVYITAMAYEVGTEYITTSHGEEQIYLSNVDALVIIADNVEDNLIFEGDIEYNDNDFGINYQGSAQAVFTQLKKEIASTISNKFKNINQ